MHIVTSLLRHGADVDAADNYGNRPITALFCNCNGDTVDFYEPSDQLLATIIAAHANVDARGPLNLTPLILASKLGDAACVEMLRSHSTHLKQ